MKSLLSFLLVSFLISCDVHGMISSKALEGYPQGYLGDCPGSNKTAIILKRSLKKLGIVVVGPKTNGKYPKRQYNYHQAKYIAKDPYLDLSKQTIMFIGGFMDSPNWFVSSYMGQTYKDLGFNVLLMEANYFLTFHYPISSRYMRPVGKYLAEMLAIVVEGGLDLNKFQMMGVSLGGQTISYIAKNFYKITGKKIPKLVGLDPSGPCFRNLGPEDRLDQTDADFVMTLNTNIDGFGMAAPVGHVNVYVNGGEYQPGDIYFMPCSVLCSHVRSYTLWIAAVKNPDKFIALKCDSVQQARSHKCYDRQPLETNIVGEAVNTTNQGIFYLATSSDYPYYLGWDGVKKENNFWSKSLSQMNARNVIKV